MTFHAGVTQNKLQALELAEPARQPRQETVDIDGLHGTDLLLPVPL
jgi:hypothetical protein